MLQLLGSQLGFILVLIIGVVPVGGINLAHT